MRHAAFAVVMLSSFTASAETPEKCRTPMTWDALLKCFEGIVVARAEVLHFTTSPLTTRILAKIPTARVVEQQVPQDGPIQFVAAVDDRGRWFLVGIPVQTERIDSLVKLTIDGRRGYAITHRADDLPFDFEVSPGATVPAIWSETKTTFCWDGNCQQVMTACDVFVRGKAYATFRGKPRFINGELSVVGDTRAAADVCNPFRKRGE